MTDIVDELRALCLEAHQVPGAERLNAEEMARLDGDPRWRAAAEIERLRRRAYGVWEPIETAPKDVGPILLYCPGLKGNAVDEVVVGVWRFDPNRRTFGYWTSDVGTLDRGFAETGPWIEYPELHPKCWAPLLPRPKQG
jgi:hypothetical protein